MSFSPLPQETLPIMQLWVDHEKLLTKIFERILKGYVDELARPATEWDAVRQMIEFSAKKQAIIDLKNILSKRYD